MPRPGAALAADMHAYVRAGKQLSQATASAIESANSANVWLLHAFACQPRHYQLNRSRQHLQLTRASFVDCIDASRSPGPACTCPLGPLTLPALPNSVNSACRRRRGSPARPVQGVPSKLRGRIALYDTLRRLRSLAGLLCLQQRHQQLCRSDVGEGLDGGQVRQDCGDVAALGQQRGEVKTFVPHENGIQAPHGSVLSGPHLRLGLGSVHHEDDLGAGAFLIDLKLDIIFVEPLSQLGLVGRHAASLLLVLRELLDPLGGPGVHLLLLGGWAEGGASEGERQAAVLVGLVVHVQQHALIHVLEKLAGDSGLLGFLHGTGLLSARGALALLVLLRLFLLLVCLALLVGRVLVLLLALLVLLLLLGRAG